MAGRFHLAPFFKLRHRFPQDLFRQQNDRHLLLPSKGRRARRTEEHGDYEIIEEGG
jgi:hypothetical protein